MVDTKNAHNAEAHEIAAKHKKIVNKILDDINNDLLIKDTLLLMDESFILISSQLDEPKINNNRGYLDVTRFLLSRGMKTFWSIRCCHIAGCDQDAWALSRNFLETEATLEYLTASPSDLSERMDRFRKFKYIEITKNANKNKEAGYECTVTVEKERLDVAEKEREKLVQKYGKSYKNHWSGKNIQKIFRDLERNQDYIDRFSSASLLTHASYLAENLYQDSPGFLASWKPSKKYSRLTGLITTGSLLNLAVRYSSFHGIKSIDPILHEIRYNLLSRFQQDGEKIENPQWKDLEPVPLNQWGSLKK